LASEIKPPLSSPKPCGDESRVQAIGGHARAMQTAALGSIGAGRCDKTTGLFLTDQTACHIDPAIGPDHARDPDTILVFASSGAAELKSWTHAMRIGRFSFAGVLRWPVNLGYWGDGHRRCEHCRTKAGDGDTCQGVFKRLSFERLVRLNHGSTGPGPLMMRRDWQNYWDFQKESVWDQPAAAIVYYSEGR